MKKITFIVFLFFSLSSYGQENFEPRLFPKSEFGLNATTFIQNVLPFSDPLIEETNFSTLFFKTGNGRVYFRSGLLFDYESEKDDFEKSSNSLIGLKLGFEKKLWLSKSWAYHFGADLFGSVLTSKVDSTDPIFGGFNFKEVQEEIGLAGVLGIQWFLNDRLALSTETYFSASRLNNIMDLGGTSTVNMNSTKIKIVTPTSIYFSFYF